MWNAYLNTIIPGIPLPPPSPNQWLPFQTLVNTAMNTTPYKWQYIPRYHGSRRLRNQTPAKSSELWPVQYYQQCTGEILTSHRSTMKLQLSLINSKQVNKWICSCQWELYIASKGWAIHNSLYVRNFCVGLQAILMAPFASGDSSQIKNIPGTFLWQCQKQSGMVAKLISTSLSSTIKSWTEQRTMKD